MKIPSFTQRPEDREMQGMTSMIDVVFLLLIFFVCASVGQRPLEFLAFESTVEGEGMDLNIEQPEVPKLLENIDLRVIRDEGQTLFQANRRLCESAQELREILTELSELAPDVPVNIDADDDVSYGDLIVVLDLCGELEFEQMNFKLPELPRGTAKAPQKRYETE